VVYTRTSDTLIALDDRGRIANREGGDLFISIHVNAANPTWKDPGGARGYETYFLSEARNGGRATGRADGKRRRSLRGVLGSSGEG
jgi:N-acetylmuramoyl-L-alanine amidase